MMSPIEIKLSHSDDSFEVDFDTTPLPIDDMSGFNDPNQNRHAFDLHRATHGHPEDGWLHNDASSHQSWIGNGDEPDGGSGGSWYERTTGSFASACCQMLPDAFMPPRHAFTPPGSPSPSGQQQQQQQQQQQTRVARSPPPPVRKPASYAPRNSSASAWRSMRSSCYEASQRYYRNDYGNQPYNRGYASYPEHPAPSPPPPPPPSPPPASSSLPVHHEPYAPQPTSGYIHQAESMDTSEYDARSYSNAHYAPPPAHDDAQGMVTPRSKNYSSAPRKYSREFREPAPDMPPIVSPTPTYPSPTTVAKATAAELCDASSICDDPQVLRPTDIVCGRGAPSQYHQGNAAFRDIISNYQTLYLCARRSEKPRIASKVLDEIGKTGGRFVRRTKKGAKSRGAGVGAFAWEEIDEKKALEKVCQALRDGAPELQRQMLAASR